MDETAYLQALMELYRDLPRQGPGDRESTLKALSLITDLPANPSILDIGCGTGAQTLDLMDAVKCSVTAIDIFNEFLESLQKRAAEKGAASRLRALQKDMNALDFPPESFDLIWSEGAIYIMGFQKGLQQWRPLLKPSGYLAITDISWIKDNPPDQLKEFWGKEYPAIASIDEHIRVIQTAGYTLTGHFTLPESSWWDSYYNPLLDSIANFQSRKAVSPAMPTVTKQTLDEIDLYRKYSDYYGYVFYIMKKE